MTNSICSFRNRFHLAALAFVFSLFASLAFGQNRTETIAATGQTAPDGNGTFSNFGFPVLNNSGEAAFLSILTGTSGASLDNRGIFRGSGGANTQIVRSGQAAPDANGTFSSLRNPVLNDSGEAAFSSSLIGTSGGTVDNGGIFRGDGGAIIQIAREGGGAPGGNGTFAGFGDPVLNNSGAAAFSASLAGTSGGSLDNSGIFRGSGGAITQIAREGQAAPDTNGMFSVFFSPALNNFGATAFQAFLTGTSSAGSDDFGIFRGSGGSITQIARRGQAAPNGNGTFSTFSNNALSDSGAVAFRASLTGTSGGSADNDGIFRGSGGAITQIAREGQAAPDANGKFSSFFDPVINDSGAAAFKAFLTGTSGGSVDDSGIFRGSGGAITQIARAGQAAPDANGTFSDFSSPALNNSGASAFFGALTGTSGGSSDNGGLYIGDGIDLIQVARQGTLVNGSAITGIGFNDSHGLNQFGQVGYLAILANGDQLIQRMTPDLHWRKTFSSSWANSSNWTLGLTPGEVHNVYIDPEASLTVYGSTGEVSVRNLFVAGNGFVPTSGEVTLQLQQGGRINIVNDMFIEANGTLTGDGIIDGNVSNYGTVVADNIRIENGGLFNEQGVVEGNGRVDASIVNYSNGNIRANNGNVLRLTGPSLSNSGRIEVINGELEVTANVQNNSGLGLITGRDATMRFNGGINNAGSIAITDGINDVFGDINNTGNISIGGDAEAIFYDDVVQNGIFQVSAAGSRTSAAILLGGFTGSGGFTGGGDVFALGDLRPGNSPGSVLYDGNLFLGSSTDTFIELGGLGIGEFDQLLVTGELNLAGDLFVSLINGYSLGANQTYLFGDIGGILSGQFNGLDEGDLVGNFSGRDLYITYGAGNGNDLALFTAVPEPGTAVFGLLGLILIASRTRRRFPSQIDRVAENV